MVTLLWKDEFVITHQEMIKGIRNQATGQYYKYFDRLVVPIIENTPEERDLATCIPLLHARQVVENKCSDKFPLHIVTAFCFATTSRRL
jgi:hypothetical protein